MAQDPNVANMTRVLSMNPQLAQQPATAMALSYSSAKDDEVAQMSGYLRGKRIAEALSGLPSEEQLRYWESMDRSDRNMAIASGYLLPIDAHEVAHQNAVEKGVGKFFGFVGKFTPNAAEKPLKATLHGYSNVVENTVQRGLRTVLVGTSDQQEGNGAFNLIHLDQWGRWWHEADKDNAALDPKAEARIRDRFGDAMVDLAHAEIRKPGYLTNAFNDLVAKGDIDQATQLDEIMRSKDFSEAFQQTQNAQISIGRVFADVVGAPFGGFEDNEKLFNILSGPIDAAWRLSTDPVNRLTTGNPSQVGPRVMPANPITDTLASKNLIRARRQQYVVPKFSESAARAKIDEAFTGTDKMSENVRRYFDGAGAHMETVRNGGPEAANAIKELRTNYRGVWPIYQQMLKYGVKDADSAHKYFTEDIGFRQILSGEKASSLKIIPYRTRMGQIWKDHKPGSVVDFFERGNSAVADSLRASAESLAGKTSKAGVQQTGQALDDWRKTWSGRIATAGRRLNTPTVSLNEHGMLNIMADDAVEQVHRLARYYGPKYWADQTAATFSKAEDVAVRKNIVKGLLATQAEATGILKSVEGKEWFAKYSKAIDDEMAGTYALGDAGKLANGERSAWLLEDARPYLPVPSFKEFHAQSAKVGMTKHLWGIANSDMVDYFMTTIWRPAMLLRPATAMRNAIDEMANVMVRNGARSFVTSRAELRVANRTQFEARQAAKSTALAADENARSLREAFDATKKPKDSATRDVHRAYRKQEKAVLKAEEDAQILHARYKGTKASFDPTAGRLYRMGQKSADALVRRAPFMPQGMKDTLSRVATGESNDIRDWYMAHMYGKLSDQWLKRFASPEDMGKLSYLDDLVNDDFIRARIEQDMIGSAKDSLAENMAKVDRVVKLPGKKGKYHYASISAPKAMSPADNAGARAWSQRLHKMADDEVAYLAMTHMDDSVKAIRLMVRALKENPEYARQLRVLGDKTPEEFAAQAFAEVKAHLSDSAGNLNQSLVDSMVTKAGGVRALNRDAFSPEKLQELPMNMRPDKIIGRDGILVQEGRSMYDLVQNAFEFMGEMTAYLSRHPQMVDEYLTARANLAPWEESVAKNFVDKGISEKRATEIARKQAHMHAVNGATEKVLAYVDNPAIRSQAAVLFRNIAPFYRAQEEFFRRWARTMKYSPEMFARANLYLDGADNSGFFFTDSDGKKYFSYPGTKVMSEAMAKMGKTFGLPMDILPVPVPMTGQVNMLAPGFQSDQWTKIFNGPIHAIPVSIMENITNNPHLTAFQRAAYGDVAAGQDWYKGFLPSAIRPFVESFTDEKRFAAMKQAAAYLVANDDPDFKAAAGGDLEAKQRVLDKLRRHANGILWTRALLAPNVPASPRVGSGNAPTTPEADPASQAQGMRYIDDRYHQLIEKVGYDEAYGYWMKEHPNEIPFLIGGTEGESQAYLPMTTRAMEFMDENRDIMTRYKKAAGFLVPQESGDTDMRAWQLAMDLGLRNFKDIGDYVDDISRATDMSFYYEQKQKYDQALLQLKASGQSGTPLRNAWSDWRDQWLPFHPLVQKEIEEGQIRQDNREATLDEFSKMLNDPDVPRTASLEKMRVLVDGYYRLQAAIAPIASKRDDMSLDQKEQMRARFQSWAKDYTASDPGAKLMFDRIFTFLD